MDKYFPKILANTRREGENKKGIDFSVFLRSLKQILLYTFQLGDFLLNGDYVSVFAH